MSKFGRKQNGRSGACEAGNLPLDRRSVIGRFRPKAVARAASPLRALLPRSGHSRLAPALPEGTAIR